jgi:hypothetical protein
MSKDFASAAHQNALKVHEVLLDFKDSNATQSIIT